MVIEALPRTTVGPHPSRVGCSCKELCVGQACLVVVTGCRAVRPCHGAHARADSADRGGDHQVLSISGATKSTIHARYDEQGSGGGSVHECIMYSKQHWRVAMQVGKKDDSILGDDEMFWKPFSHGYVCNVCVNCVRCTRWEMYPDGSRACSLLPTRRCCRAPQLGLHLNVGETVCCCGMVDTGHARSVRGGRSKHRGAGLQAPPGTSFPRMLPTTSPQPKPHSARFKAQSGASCLGLHAPWFGMC